MKEFIAGMLAGSFILWVVGVIIGAFRENKKLEEQLKNYEKCEKPKEIVYCKNCIHHRYDDEEFQCTVWNCEVKADGYCDRAERIIK